MAQKVEFQRTKSAAMRLADGSKVGALRPKDNGQELYEGDLVRVYDRRGNVLGESAVKEAIPVVPGRVQERRRLSHEAGGEQLTRGVTGGGCILDNGEHISLRYLLEKL